MSSSASVAPSLRTSSKWSRAEAALTHYRAQAWSEAARWFGEALALCPADRPIELMLERCERYRQTPPAAEWDGVHRSAHK